MHAYVINSNGSYNNLSSFSSDIHQSQKAVYWRMVCKWTPLLQVCFETFLAMTYRETQYQTCSIMAHTWLSAFSRYNQMLNYQMMSTSVDYAHIYICTICSWQ